MSNTLAVYAGGYEDALQLFAPADVLRRAAFARRNLSMTSLLQQLQTLEVELHHPGVRCSRERLEQLLHPEFHEVGRSGRAYNRESIIGYLGSEGTQPIVASENFAVVELGPEVALLTYRSAHVVPGERLANHALRSSIWVKPASDWQLRYHQGTAAEHEW